MRRLVFLGLLLCAAASASAADNAARCKTSSKLTGSCFIVHGRLSITNGTVIYRIWPIGTHRMLGVVDGAGLAHDEPGPPLPPDVRTGLNGFDTDVFADYEVCPLTRSEPGHMQHVCVESASHIFVHRR